LVTISLADPMSDRSLPPGARKEGTKIRKKVESARLSTKRESASDLPGSATSLARNGELGRKKAIHRPAAPEENAELLQRPARTGLLRPPYKQHSLRANRVDSRRGSRQGRARAKFEEPARSESATTERVGIKR